ncbi:PAS domain S-box-containing protein [Nakamurella sp. UYEF19]|uniref:PAS domain-containing sensor histidine kinase n=1 Tax=Nakamurella sp. UYEF19 TaxID=1756392 RepID=UPI003395EE4F
MHTDVTTAPAWPPATTADVVLRALVDVSADGLAVLDTDGRFVGLNANAAAILGLPDADLVGRTAPFAIDPLSEDAVGGLHTTAWTTQDRRRRDLEYRLEQIPGSSGQVVWFRDVTDALRQQERLTAIVRVSSSVADAGSLHATLDAVAHEIYMTANIAAVQIHLAMDDPTDEVRILGMAGFGDAAGFTERLSACRRLGADIRFLEAIERVEAVVIPHRKATVMADPDWAPLHAIMDQPNWDGFVAMPLIVRGRALGVINAYYVPGEDPGPQSLDFLRAMAEYAAVAIDTAQLLAQTRSQVRLDERRRLSRDLHDSVVQQLFSMRLQTTALRSAAASQNLDTASVCGAAEELAELAQNALADVRRLMFELRPLDLTERDLFDAVRAHAASLRARTGLIVDVRAPCDVESDLPVDLQEDLYRIVQEALQNVVKHARANHVSIDITDGDGFVVEVSDDGCSPHPDLGTTASAPATTLGLMSMRERTERWGGRLVVGPRPDGGWSVRVVLPRVGRSVADADHRERSGHLRGER